MTELSKKRAAMAAKRKIRFRHHEKDEKKTSESSESPIKKEEIIPTPINEGETSEILNKEEMKNSINKKTHIKLSTIKEEKSTSVSLKEEIVSVPIEEGEIEEGEIETDQIEKATNPGIISNSGIDPSQFEKPFTMNNLPEIGPSDVNVTVHYFL